MFRIRISFNADPDPAFYDNADPDQGFDDQKLTNMYSLKKKIFDQKMQFTYLKAILNVHATGEDLSPQKRTLQRNKT